jgi:DNA-binding IclR family transcriptional regulator
MAILEAVAARAHGASVTDVATESGLNVATTSRLLREMAAVGLVSRSDATGTYRLGARMFTMARVATRRGTLIEAATPVMRAVRDASGETVSLHIRVAAHRVCVAEVQSDQDLRRVVPVGLTLPLHVGATGKALLAHLPADIQDDYLETLSADEATQIQPLLEAARRDGFSYAIDALARGVSGLAAPVFEADSAVAVISVSGPSLRWTADRMTQFAPDLVQIAAELSRHVQGAGDEITVPGVRGVADGSGIAAAAGPVGKR